MTSSVSNDIARVLDDAQAGRMPPPVPYAPVEFESVQSPAPTAPGRASVWMTLAVAGVILSAYGLLQNPYWVHGGDSEVYLCLARNLALGKGYVFNGQPVSMVPPGWPLLLAGAMKITSSFLLLKMIPMLCMAGGMILFYLALRGRVALPSTAAITMIVTALLAPIYTLTVWFHSESSFMLCFAAALLMAARINDGQKQWWRIALLAIFCGLSVTARPAGMALFPVIAGMLLNGQFVPRLNRLWIAVALAGVVTAGTFVTLRLAQHVRQQDLDPRFDASLSGSYEIVNAAEKQPDDTYASRLYDAPMWVAGLFWQPATISPLNGLRETARVTGWIVLGLFVIKLVPALARREWVWLGVALYAGYLIINWPSPVARYFIPIAPFLFIAALDAMSWLASWIGRTDWREGWTLGLRCGFVGLVLLPNVGMYCYDAWIMRSPHFYQRYMGGTLETLIEATTWLRHQGLRNGDLAVSRRYATPDAERMTNGWMRATCTLTNVAVMTPPDKLSQKPEWADMKAWLAENHVRYYLYLPTVYAYGSIRRLTSNGLMIQPEDTEWRLYEVVDGDVRRVPFMRTVTVPAPTKPGAAPTTQTVDVRRPIANAEFHPVTHVPGL